MDDHYFCCISFDFRNREIPGAAKKLGKAVNEYNKAKNEIQEQMKECNR